MVLGTLKILFTLFYVCALSHNKINTKKKCPTISNVAKLAMRTED